MSRSDFDGSEGEQLNETQRGASETVSVVAIAIALLRSRWMIVGTTVAFSAIVAIALLLSAPTWTATTSFLPHSTEGASSSRLANLAGRFGVDVGTGGGGQGPQFYADLVRSRAILRQLTYDTFTVDLDPSDEVEKWEAGTLATLLEIDADDDDVRIAEVVAWLREVALSVTTSDETGVVNLAVTTPWPVLSQQLGRRVVELLNEFNLDLRHSEAEAERHFIENRLADAQSQLQAAEDALQRFLGSNRAFENSPELVFEHDRLQRRVSFRQQLYLTIAESYEQARVSEVRNTPVITVVEPSAVPVRPDPRNRLLKVLLAALVGGVLGACMGIAREIVLQRPRYLDDDVEELRQLWLETKEQIVALRRPF